MIYQCNDKYLAAVLLTYSSFQYVGYDAENYIISYSNKSRLIKLLEQYVNMTLKVDFIKYQNNLSFLEGELQKDN
jgi:hypothetical protein